MLAQLEERGFVKNLVKALGYLTARADKVCFDRAVKLALTEVVLPELVVLSLFRCASVISLFNSFRVVYEQYGGAAVELGAYGVEQMAEKVAVDRVVLGSIIESESREAQLRGGSQAA
eukprot:6192089-Pleurochrysis_carterae.AAC.1